MAGVGSVTDLHEADALQPKRINRGADDLHAADTLPAVTEGGRSTKTLLWKDASLDAEETLTPRRRSANRSAEKSHILKWKCSSSGTPFSDSDDGYDDARTPTPPPMSAPSMATHSYSDWFPAPRPTTAPSVIVTSLAAKYSVPPEEDVTSPKDTSLATKVNVADAGTEYINPTVLNSVVSLMNGRFKTVEADVDTLETSVAENLAVKAKSHPEKNHMGWRKIQAFVRQVPKEVLPSADLEKSARLRIEDYEAQLAELKPQLKQSRKQCATSRVLVKELRAKETAEKTAMWTKQYEMDEKLLHVVTRLQRNWRGYLLRKHLLSRQDAEKAKERIWESELPKQLAANLLAMRLNCHGLMFREHDRHWAAVRLQAWWRCVLARRMALFLRSATWMMQLNAMMEQAAVRMQSRFRSRLTRRYLYRAIQRKIKERSEEQYIQMVKDHAQIVKLQRRIRQMLAFRKIARAVALRDAVGMGPPRSANPDGKVSTMRLSAVYHGTEVAEGYVVTQAVDSWSPSLAGARPSIAETPQDSTLHRVAQTGKEPFFSTVRDLPHHRIGGVTAVNMLFALGMAPVDTDLLSTIVQSPRSSVGSSSASAGTRNCSLPDALSIPFSLDLYDVYPCGTRVGTRALVNAALKEGNFRTSEPADIESSSVASSSTWDHVSKDATRPRKPRRATNKPKLATVPVECLPLNSLKRAGRFRLTAVEEPRNEGTLSHPMFDNAPPVPLPPPTPRPPDGLRPAWYGMPAGVRFVDAKRSDLQ